MIKPPENQTAQDNETSVLHLLDDVGIAHVYKSCKFDEKIIGSPMKAGGLRPHGFKVGRGQLSHCPHGSCILGPC